MDSKFVVGLGEILWDCLPQGRKMGGAPANFAYHVSQFGLPSCVVSAVGKDDLGTEIIENLQSKKICFNVPQIEFPTGTVQVSLDGNGVPKYDICKDVAWDNVPFTDKLLELSKNAIAVSFGSLAQRNACTRDTIYKFLDNMPEGDGVLKVFDINLRQNFYNEEIIRESLKRCNVLKINDEEIAVIRNMFGYSCDNEQLCLKLLKEFNLSMLILTCGTNGSYVFNKDNEGWSFLPTPKVTVADTVGAGDSFTAAFVASILKGKNIYESHKIAVEVSAFVCTQDGAMPVLQHSTRTIFT